MPDEAELCCGAGICCNKAKRRVALAKILRERVPAISDKQSLELADAVHDDFDIVPRSLNLGDFLERFAAMARERPYT